jgi:hypothetical protein
VEPDLVGGPGPVLPIAEVAQGTGLIEGHPRYSEKAGLFAAVDRSSGGQRCYATTDLVRLAFLLRLRATGMSIADMQRFAALPAWAVPALSTGSTCSPAIAMASNGTSPTCRATTSPRQRDR